MPRGFAVVVCVMGVALLLVGLHLSRLGRAARGFTHTRGRVLAAAVETIPAPAEEGGPRYRAVVRYAFEARGRTFESERIAPAGSGRFEDADREAVRRFVERFPAGGEVDVWFDPADPRRSALVRDVPYTAVVVAITAGLALLGIGLFALARASAGRPFGT